MTHNPATARVTFPTGGIDTHAHVFSRPLSWLAASDQPPTSTVADLAGIYNSARASAILIQAENRCAVEPGLLMGASVSHPGQFAGAVIGVDLIQSPARLREVLEQQKAQRGFLGIRFLLECEHAALIANEKGGIRNKFVESLGILAELGILFEFCGWNWQHQDILQIIALPELAKLRAVLDHCLKFRPDPAMPSSLPIGFAGVMNHVASFPNVVVKWSELLKYVEPKGNGKDKWTIEEAAHPMGTMLRHLISTVGAERVIWGSGWPVASWSETVEGTGEKGAITYDDVIRASLLAMDSADVSQEIVNLIMRDNARKVYGIDVG